MEEQGITSNTGSLGDFKALRKGMGGEVGSLTQALVSLKELRWEDKGIVKSMKTN